MTRNSSVSLPVETSRFLAALLLAAVSALGTAGAAEEAEAPAKPDEAARVIATALKDPAEDPLVRTLFESNPSTPKELMRAIKILVDIDRPKLARPLANKFLDARPTPRDMDEMLEQFGTGTFMAWAANPQLAPEMGRMVEQVLAGSLAYRQDPQRLAKMIAAMKSPVERTRQEAVVQLARAHIAAVGPLIRVLADPKRAAEHGAVRTLLVHMASDANGPLAGALEVGDPDLKSQIVEVIGRQRDRQSLLPLVGLSLDPRADPAVGEAARRAVIAITGQPADLGEAQTALQREITRLLADAAAHSGELTPKTEVWHWDAQSNESVVKELPSAVASADRAANLARDLFALRPNHAPTRRLCLTALLTAAKLDQDFDQELPRGAGTAFDVAAEQGMDAVDDVLAEALSSGNVPAATAAAEILGEIGKASLLTRFGQRPAPLALAAQVSDRRVRFAALNAILTLAPEVPFPGASAVAENLGYFAGSAGVSRVLIGHPRTEMAQAIVGLLGEFGYDGDVATNGRQTFALAAGSPDYDFILLHFQLERPQIDDLLSSFRRDPRTQRLPIGIIALPENLKRAERLAEGTPWVSAFADPGIPKIMKYQVDELTRFAGRHNVPFAQRQRQALVALEWIARLTEKPSGSIYDLKPLVPKVTLALTVPGLKGAAITALANLGTVAGQQALVEVVNQGTQPLAARQGAAEAFWRSVQLHGILLTKGEMLRQYERYNASAQADREVQKVFASILDTLERRDDSAESAALK